MWLKPEYKINVFKFSSFADSPLHIRLSNFSWPNIIFNLHFNSHSLAVGCRSSFMLFVGIRFKSLSVIQLTKKLDR